MKVRDCLIASLFVVLAAGCGEPGLSTAVSAEKEVKPMKTESPADAKVDTKTDVKTVRKTNAEWKKLLTPASHDIARA